MKHTNIRRPTLKDLPPPPSGRSGWPWTEESTQIPAALPGGRPWPRISIVTASYNQGLFIEETIRSILLQGYPNLEYIVMDGGSTDGSVEVIRKYEQHLAFWQSETDHGAADALRKGFEKTSGSILAYLNSDDVYLPGTFQQIAKAFAQSQRVDFVYGNVYWMDPDNRILGERRQARFLKLGFLYGGSDLLQPATFWSREIYGKARGIDPVFRFHFDLDLFYRFVLLGARFQRCNGFFASFRIHPTSKSSTLAETYRDELHRIRTKYLPVPVNSVRGRLWRNIGRLHRLFWYTLQGDLPWLLGRIPDRFRSRTTDAVVGPRTRW